MKKHRFVIALVGLSLFAASSTIAADMTQANMDQHSVKMCIRDSLYGCQRYRDYSRPARQSNGRVQSRWLATAS